jgi:hypothetical protein
MGIIYMDGEKRGGWERTAIVVVVVVVIVIYYSLVTSDERSSFYLLSFCCPLWLMPEMPKVFQRCLIA